jgi:hypothetical protein
MTKLIGASLLVALAGMPGATLAGEGQQPPAAQRPQKAIDPTADRMLRQMTDYLAGLQSFKVQSSAVDEVVLQSGQKIQYASDSLVSVERPNRLRSEQLGEGLALWYDGKTMTLECKANKSFATIPAPAKLDPAIDTLRKRFQIEAPGADLLFSNPYDILTEQVKSGQFVGRETINGVPTNHLAFVGEEVDWQIWIQDGPQPLPLRFSITSKTVVGQPEFAIQLSHWQPQARLPASTFEFQAPSGATRVQSFPTSCRAPG